MENIKKTTTLADMYQELLKLSFKVIDTVEGSTLPDKEKIKKIKRIGDNFKELVFKIRKVFNKEVEGGPALIKFLFEGFKMLLNEIEEEINNENA